MNLSLIKDELLEAQTVLTAFLSDQQNLQHIEDAASLLAESFKNEGKV